MKTIAYKDNAGRQIKEYFVDGETRHQRIQNALKELQHMGNITIYLVNGNKCRKLFRKSY